MNVVSECGGVQIRLDEFGAENHFSLYGWTAEVYGNRHGNRNVAVEDLDLWKLQKIGVFSAAEEKTCNQFM